MFILNMGLHWNYKGKIGTESLFHEAIDDFKGQLSDWSNAFSQFRDDILAPSVRDQFNTQGQGQWQGLAESTIKQKGSDVILFRDGGLWRSFETGGEGNIDFIGPRSMQWGSSLMRALFHQ